VSRGKGTPNEFRVLDSTYSVSIEVQRSRTTVTANDNGYFDEPERTSAGRLARIELTARTLEELVLKIKQHADLLEDE